MPHIDTLVFDFGNIFIDLDIPATETALRKLIGTAAPMSDQLFFEWMCRYEKGEVFEESFMNALQRHTEPVVEGRQILAAWNAMLLGLPAHRLTWLKTLRPQYRVFLLSNTNQSHLEWVDRHLQKQHKINIETFNATYFDKAYYSHLIGYRKPDQSCYDWVAEDANLDLNTTLFIDDNKDNIAGALAAGWQAVLHDPSQDIVDMLETYLN